MANPLTSPWRITMIICNLLYSVGAFYVDWSVTHVLNPRWTPHARFHNGQTMTLGALLCSAVIYLLSRPASTKEVAKEYLWMAALVGTMYCSAGLSAIFYPGTDWADPEYHIPYAPQAWLFGGIVVMNWVAWYYESRRLEGQQIGGRRKGN